MPTSGRISDAAVKAKTGKAWKEWFELLDTAGANRMAHKEIAEYLGGAGMPSWWCQMVAVAYEQERGLREKYQQAEGKGYYSASASRDLFAVPLDILYKTWADETLRSKWLKDRIFVRKATAGKSIRITWHDGTFVEAYFYGKGSNKSQIAVQHRKLEGRKDVERMKAHWQAALDRLEKLLDDSGL